MATTRPAAPHVPRNDLQSLTDKQRTILARAARDNADHRMLIYTLLASNQWDEEVVEDAMHTLITYLARPASNTAVAAFYGYEPCGAPKACTALLEDGRGGVARDVHGFPICVTFGVAPALDAQTMIEWSAWLFWRIKTHMGDNEIPQSTNVIDLRCRQHLDANKSVPMPDAKVLELSALLPNASTKTYVCGAQGAFRTFLDAMRKIPMLRRYVDNFVLCDDYSVLEGVVPPEHMLPWWRSDGASFDFHLDHYASWLCE